ncbi:MAG: transporter substrate-binding domain-containing protein [Bdellovibrionales bacterium]|jgi:polar amino acid transport system substrate-binding protein
MKNQSAIWTILISVVIALGIQNFALRPATTASASKESAYDRVMRTNTLRCAYALYPPFISKDPNTGKLGGIAPALMAEVEKATGLNVVWGPEIDFGDITPTLQTGKADAFCTGMAMTPARGRVLLGSTPFSYGAIEAYVRKNDTRFDNNPDSINRPDIKIEVNMGDLSEAIAKRFFPKATLVYRGTVGGEDQLFLDVAMKKADLTISGPSNLSLYNENNKATALRQVQLMRPLNTLSGVIAVGIHETALMNVINASLYDLIDNGVVDRILKTETGKDYGKGIISPKPRI